MSDLSKIAFNTVHAPDFGTANALYLNSQEQAINALQSAKNTWNELYDDVRAKNQAIIQQHLNGLNRQDFAVPSAIGQGLNALYEQHKMNDEFDHARVNTYVDTRPTTLLERDVKDLAHRQDTYGFGKTKLSDAKQAIGNYTEGQIINGVYDVPSPDNPLGNIQVNSSNPLFMQPLRDDVDNKVNTALHDPDVSALSHAKDELGNTANALYYSIPNIQANYHTGQLDAVNKLGDGYMRLNGEGILNTAFGEVDGYTPVVNDKGELLHYTNENGDKVSYTKYREHAINNAVADVPELVKPYVVNQIIKKVNSDNEADKQLANEIAKENRGLQNKITLQGIAGKIASSLQTQKTNDAINIGASHVAMGFNPNGGNLPNPNTSDSGGNGKGKDGGKNNSKTFKNLGVNITDDNGNYDLNAFSTAVSNRLTTIDNNMSKSIYDSRGGYEAPDFSNWVQKNRERFSQLDKDKSTWRDYSHNALSYVTSFVNKHADKFGSEQAKKEFAEYILTNKPNLGKKKNFYILGANNDHVDTELGSWLGIDNTGRVSDKIKSDVSAMIAFANNEAVRKADNHKSAFIIQVFNNLADDLGNNTVALPELFAKAGINENHAIWKYLDKNTQQQMLIAPIFNPNQSSVATFKNQSPASNNNKKISDLLKQKPK